jgi:hypothetical protein
MCSSSSKELQCDSQTQYHLRMQNPVVPIFLLLSALPQAAISSACGVAFTSFIGLLQQIR